MPLEVRLRVWADIAALIEVSLRMSGVEYAESRARLSGPRLATMQDDW
jgi:hypothetical protein